MNDPRIIVIGASAGGVEALVGVVKDLPKDIPAAIFIVLHVPAYGMSVLPDILRRRSSLPAFHPADAQAIEAGNIYVAPPDHHLMMEDGRIRLTHGPTENRVRPSVDVLFRSAAHAYGPLVTGVILSGMLDDGTAGAQSVKSRGGSMIVQDPKEATFPGMPQSAIEHVDIDYVLPLADIAPALVRLTSEPVVSSVTLPVSSSMTTEVKMATLTPDAFEGEHPGTPSVYACPECHGVLWEIEEGRLVRYRCRVGHAYSPASLLAEQSEVLEDTLWIALRAFEENAALAERLKGRAAERGHHISAGHFAEQSRQALERAEIIRQALLRGQIAAANPPDTDLPPAAT